MRRTIIVGDVHGCAAELDALLDRVAFSAGDRLVLVGDVVARGPDPRGAIDIVRRTRAVLVRGNHEEKLLRWRAHAKGAHALGRVHEEVVRVLRDVDWKVLEATPLSYDLPEHGVRVVHAGVMPGVPFEEQDPDTLLHIRGVTPRGHPTPSAEAPPWGALYQGPPHVVFGHNARPEPQLYAWATGLDTGCVYGGHLTALVLDEGERMPRGLRAREHLVSVPARRAYWLGKRASSGQRAGGYAARWQARRAP